MANAAEVLAQFANLPVGSAISNWRAESEALNQEAYNAAAAEAAGVPYSPKIVDANPLSAPISAAVGSQNFARDRNSFRSDGAAIADIIHSVASSPISMVGGIGALGLGLVNNEAGAWAAQKMTDFNQWSAEGQSAGLKNVLRATEAMDAATTTSNEAIYQTEKADRGNLVAKFRREGRNILSGVSNAIDNPAAFGDGLSNAVGSLLVGGPLSKVVGSTGSAAVKGLLSRGVISEGVALQATKFGSKITMPGTIGAMEAGGTYQQTVQQISDMSHEELLQSSPEYAELIAADPNSIELRTQAKNQIANSAGLVAAAIQFPIAAAAGKIVSKFERSPFKIPTSGGAAAGNMFKEGVEEFIQSGSGQFASNVGIGQYADTNQDVLSGVGQQAGIGALYGIGSAGVAQAPGLAIRGTVGTAKLGAKAAVAAGSAIAQPFINRLEAIDAKREASSDVSSDKLNARVQETLTDLPTISAKLDQDIADNKFTPETATLLQEHLAKLDQTMRFDPTELDTLPVSDGVKATLATATNQFEALSLAAAIASGKDSAPEDRIDAAIYINDTLAKVGPQMTKALVDAMDPLAETDTEYLPKLRAIDDLLMSFQQNPRIMKAMSYAQKRVASYKLADIAGDAIATPKGQQAVRSIVSIAEADPTAISGDIADVIAEHARNGRYTLNANQSRAIATSSVIARVGQTYVQRANKLQIKPIDIVHHEILNNHYNDNTKELSAAGHAQEVMKAMRAGNPETAAKALDRMMKFALHMSNKVGAVNENFAAGNGSEKNTTKFTGVTPGGRMLPTIKGVWINPTVPGSVGLAQRISMEADAIGTMANELARQMPELGVAPIEITKLNSELEGPSNEVAARFKKAAKPAATKPTVEKPAKADPAQKVKTESKAETEKPAATPAAETTFIPDVAAMTDSEIDLRLEDLANKTFSDLTKEERLTASAVRVEKARRTQAASEVVSEDSVPENFLPPAKNSTKPESETEDTGAVIDTDVSTQAAQKVLDNILLDNPDTTSVVAGARAVRLKPGMGRAVSKFLNGVGSSIGVDLSKVLNGVFAVVGPNSDVGMPNGMTGLATTEGRYIFINQTRLNKLRKVVSQSGRGFKALILHELGHLMHYAGYESGEFGDRLFREDGDLFKEFKSADFSGAFLGPDIAYIEGFSGQQFINEFVAEAFRIVMMYPESIERIPNVYAEIEILIEASGGNAQALRNRSVGAIAGIQKERQRNNAGKTGTGSVGRVGSDGRVSKPQSIKDAFSDLIDSEDGTVQNWFHRAFNMPKKVRSRLLEAASALGLVKDALSSREALESLLEREIDEEFDDELDGENRKARKGKSLTADLVRTYADYLGRVPSMSKFLNDRLKTELQKKHSSGVTMAQALTDGLLFKSQVNELLGYKALSLLEQQPDGTYAFNQKLLEGALLAGLQWAILSGNEGRVYDGESLAKTLGIDESVAEFHYHWFNEGMPIISVKRNLASSIVKYWGLDRNPNTPIGYIEGIAEDMASQVIRALEDSGLIELDKETRRIGDKTYQRLLPGTTNEDLFKDFANYTTAIEEVVLVEPENINFIGEPPVAVPETQLHNSPVPTTTQVKAAAKAAQDTPFKLNLTMLSFVEMLGNTGVKQLFGKGSETQKDINENTRKSINGFNLTLMSAHTHLFNLVGEMRGFAERNGLALGNVPMFFKYGFSSVGRLQMIGKASPQASKLIREVLLSTESTLDLTDTSGDQYRAFILAIAQHLGIKIHNMPVIDGVNQGIVQVLDQLGEEYADLVDLFGEWQAAEKTNEKLSFESEDIELIKEKLGSKLSVGAVHAIMEFSRYMNSTKEERAKFTTQLYLEADGITDGPINAHINMTTGPFTVKWMDIAARGGLSFGSKRMSINDFVNMNDKNKDDLYQLTTNFFKGELAKVKTKFQKNYYLRTASNNTYKFLDRYLQDIEFNDQGDITYKRGIAKSPMTVTVYGSGVKGIASKIAAAALNSLYQELSEGKLLTREMQAILKEIGTTELIQGDFGRISVKNRSDSMNTYTGSGVQFSLNEAMVKNLEAHVMHFFAKPLRKAVTSVIGDAMDTGTLIKQATQVQSIYFKYDFRQAIAEAMANKDGYDGTKDKDFLSRAELDRIFKELIKKYPMISTGTQMIWVGGSERSDLEMTAFGQDFNDSLRTPGYVYGPKNSGVSGIPYIVIATGDGQMILNALTGENAPKGILPVFDGINMKLDTIREDSEKINKAVYDGWMKNPIRAVEKSFTEFWTTTGSKVLDTNMSEEMVEELWKAVGTFDDVGIKFAPTPLITGVLFELRSAANSLDARKAVLAKVNMSVDHMASASSPYTKTDGIELPADPVEAAAALNEMYSEELAKIEKAQGMKSSAKTTEPSEDISKVFEFSGGLGAKPVFGAYELGRTILQRLVPTLNVPEDQKYLIRASINSLHTKGWRIVHGSIAGLQEYAENKGITLPDNWQLNEGMANIRSKRILLRSASSESLAHELIHAATLEQIHAYYVDPNSVPVAAQDAIKRIELLLGDFLRLDTSKMDAKTLAAFEDVKAAMEKIDNKPRITEAVRDATRLNEFMAWVLANQDLTKLAKANDVKSPLARIVATALALLKKLWKSGLAPQIGTDIYSNLRFNTMVLMQLKPDMYGNPEQLGSQAHFQSSTYGSSDYLTALQLKFDERIMAAGDRLTASSNPGQQMANGVVHPELLQLRSTADRVKRSFQAHHFNMTPQEASLFETLIIAFGIDATLDSNVQSRMQDAFSAALSVITVEDFMVDPVANDPNDRTRAEAKLNLINGKYFVGRDAIGRSTLLPAFVALASVNPEFRAVLAKIDVPKTVKDSDGTFDGWVANAGETMMDRLNKAFSGEGNKSQTVLAAMNLMTDRLAESDIDRASIIEQHISPIGNAIDKGNNWFVNLKDDYTQKWADYLSNVRATNTNKGVLLAARAGEAALGIFNEDIGNNLAMAGQSILDKTKLWKAVPEIWSEVIGRTKENAPIYDMIKKSRAFIQQLRQAYRNQLPNIISKEFTRTLTKDEWTTLHDTMMSTDLAALIPLGSNGVLELLRDGQKVQREITRLEGVISSLDPGHDALLIRKSKELATYMTSKRVSGNLLRNAEAIAELFNELPTGRRNRRGSPSPRMISAIDQLVSLYALQAVPTETRTKAAQLAANESAGLAFTLEYLVALREAEQSKAWTQRAKINHYKGFVPGETKAGASLIVADTRDHSDLLARGYVQVGRYMGSAAEGANFSRGYYFAPLSGKAAFNQGIAQNIRHTFYGVDPVTGFSTDTFGAGVITNQALVASIKTQRGTNNAASEPLMPIFDDQGDVVAYERSVTPDHIARLDRETDLTKVMGIWRGRQIEEAASDSFNNELVGKLHDLWVGESVNRRDEYVNLMDPSDHKDPVITDAMRLISPRMREEIEAKFGSTGFMVKKSMINDAIGYRSPSIGDLWTGNTRIDPRTAKVASNILTAVIGKDAFKYLVTGEKLWQNFVADARTTIVVKSVIVPAANILSNIYQLSARGVPLAYIVKAMPKKLSEVQAYHKNRLREIEIEAQILAAKNNLPRLNALRTEMKSIKDSYRRLTIWPLIENGEFTSVAEGLVSKEETTLFEGKLNQYIEGLAEKLPDGLKTAGKYAMVSRDTALFQGLQKAVEYGDFLAKAVLYDDLTKRKKMTREAALIQISEEYVNFDRLPGRFRGALEANGLLWFWHFKLRSIKVGLSIIRNNPLHALLTGLAPTPDVFGSIGSPITDNALGVWYNGKMHYSVGIMQGIHAHSLNPTVNFLT